MAAATKHAKVELTIHRAEGLVALNPGNSSNPYVSATVGAQTAITPVQNKTVNPVFDATFTFVDCPLPTVVSLRVFNKLPFADVEDPLGTATLTLFSVCPTTKKTVELTHGGDANLAQRAATNGCGQVFVSYSVSEMPVEETAAATATMSSPFGVPAMPTTTSSLPGSQAGSQIRLQPPVLPSASSSTATLPSHMSLLGFGGNNSSTPPSQPQQQQPPQQPPQPIPVPLAHNMTGVPALPVPPSLNASTSHHSGSGSPALGGISSASQHALVPPPLISASPSMTPNPALQRSPKISNNVSPQSSIPANSNLTPPSLVPAQVPAVLTPFIANSAAAPPANVPAPLLTKATNVPAYVSYPVAGLRPVEVPAAAAGAETTAVPVPIPDTLYYANNTNAANVRVSATPATAPTPTQRPFVPQAASAMPFLKQPNVSDTIYEGTAARSLNAQQQQPSISSSLTYGATSQAPHPTTQRLLVLPPHIEGQPQPTPTFNHPSSTPHTPPSASELPTSTANPQFTAPPLSQSASPPSVQPMMQGSFSQGSLPVAVAPRTQPLSSSTSTSRTTTPSIHAGRPGPISEFPSAAPGVTRSPFCRPVGSVQPLGTDSPGVCRPRRDEAAIPPMATTSRDLARRKESGTGSRTQSGTRIGGGAALPSGTSGAASGAGGGGAGAAMEAAHVYADPTYLFENAASGRDLQVFRKLRQADPHLANGFLQCRDYAGRTLLHIAAWHGQLAVLEVLLAPTPATEGHLPMLDLRAVVAPNSGNTILHAAAYGGQAEVAQWLRYTHPTAGALLLDMRNQRGMTAAQCAKESGFDTVARLLLPN